MRITNSMMTNTFLRNLYTNMERMDKYQNQLATNRKLVRLSDDPIGAIKSMDARVKLYRIEQYQKNVDNAQSWLTQAETSLLELSGVLTQAYEKTVQAASDFNNQSDRQAIAELMKQLRAQVVDIGNTKMGEHYIFGGFNTNAQPFALVPADPTAGTAAYVTYNGIPMYDDGTGAVYDDAVQGEALREENKQILMYEIGFGMDTEATIPGPRLMGMGDDNIFKIFDELCAALENNDRDTISASITKLQDAQAKTLALTSNIGGRTIRLDLMTDRYANDTLNYTSIKSNVEDIQEAEAIMQWKTAQSVYTAALQVGAQIMQTKLLDFIR